MAKANDKKVDDYDVGIPSPPTKSGAPVKDSALLDSACPKLTTSEAIRTGKVKTSWRKR